MPVEIEYKFLVEGDEWKSFAHNKTRITQGYLNSAPERTTRVRVKGDEAYLTIKGKNRSVTRLEFEYSIPVDHAEQLLLLCEQPLIDKVRYEIKVGNHLWEVDEFFGDNVGLIVAEIELSSEEDEFEKPNWLGVGVSGDTRYFNSALIKHPFKNW